MKTFKAFVVNNRIQANRLQPILGDEWIVLCPGQALSGYTFSAVVFSQGWSNGHNSDTAHEWANHLTKIRSVTPAPISKL